MGFNIDSMVSRYSDFARGYLFYAQITNSPIGGVLSSDHPYLVNASSLPAQSIEEISTDFQGMAYKIGATNTFEDFNITFKCDTAQDVRKAFLEWMSLVHNPVTNVHGVPSEYMGQVGLTQLNVNGDAIIRYDLVKAWPSNVGEITLDYSDKSISTFDVTFKYLYHVIDTVADGSALGAEVF